MTDKIDVPLHVGHPLSGLEFPDDALFTNDREGIDAMILLHGHADRLSAMVEANCPIQAIKAQLAVLNEIFTKAAHREAVMRVSRDPRASRQRSKAN